MTREAKLEAMARAWCQFNGWNPDHRPWVLKADWDDDGPSSWREQHGEPIWKAHVKAMDHLLRAIGE